DAVGRALVLDLEHLALARQVRQRQGLRDHPVQPRPFEVTEPERRDRAILGRWRQMQRRTQLRELALEQLAPLAERAIEQRAGPERQKVEDDERRRRIASERR